MCLTSFTAALIFTLGSGNYWLEIFNSYVGSLPLLIIAFFEIIAVVYIYGINRCPIFLFLNDFAIEKPVSIYSYDKSPQKICIFQQCLTKYCHVLRFSEDIEWMTGRRPNIFWQATWRVISPLMLLVVFLAYVVVQAETQPTYDAWNPDYVIEV